jgi:hypothetical protein
MLKNAMAAVVVSAALSSSASAAILIFTDSFLFDIQTASLTRSSENFNAYSGAYASPLTGSAGAVNWSATASAGLNVAGGQLSAGSPGPMTIAFSGADVYGISGNFFGTDGASTVVPSLVLVSLNDGTSYLNLIDTSTVFVGFVSTGAAISSISVSAQPLPGGATSVYPTVDNLGFAYVPAPGAIALLGLAGLAALRRRR